ncbi:MAG: homoserine kinase [Alphaproteobacteria bacterium]|nr:homoserine kinase [Alphaproteobacteria bacterium]
MAVYTEVSDADLDAFLRQYDIGEALSCKGIAEGVENSNYLLQTDRGNFILTLYEKRVARDDLPFFLGLLDHLASRDFPCPTPIHGRDGAALRDLCGRPAAIVGFLAGMWPRRPSPDHCRALGEATARMHLAAADFPLRRENALGPAGWRALFEATRDRAHEVHAGLARAVGDELAWLEDHWPRDLPAGIIHADLFPDNVFFRHDRLSGIIDFYFACNDFLVYELAICLNAWCFEGDGSFNITKARSLLAGYGAVRPIGRDELAALPLLARGGALRFLLTRLYDWLNQPEGALVRPKNPLEYLSRLRFHQGVKSPAAYGLD